MALTESKEVKRQDGKILAYEVATGESIYKGAAVVLSATGELEAGADEADKKFAGIAVEPNSEQILGEEKTKDYVRVYKDGVFDFEIETNADPVIGDVVYLVDDETISDLASDSGDTGNEVANDIEVGHVVGLTSDGKARVRIDNKVN